MKELSVFFDESGDFVEMRDIRDYYPVTFVFMTKMKIFQRIQDD